MLDVGPAFRTWFTDEHCFIFLSDISFVNDKRHTEAPQKAAEKLAARILRNKIQTQAARGSGRPLISVGWAWPEYSTMAELWWWGTGLVGLGAG